MASLIEQIIQKITFAGATRELLRQSFIRGGENLSPTDPFRSYVAAADRIVEKIGTGGGGAVEPTLGFLPTQWDVAGRIVRGKWYGGGSIPNLYFTGGNGAGYGSLTEVDGLETVTSIGQASFHQLGSFLKVVAPAVVTLGSNAFVQNTNLQLADFTALSNLPDGTFYLCPALTTLILRRASVTTLGATNVLTGTPIANGTGYVYVPAVLVSAYKVNTNWPAFANQIRAIEDFPEITGE